MLTEEEWDRIKISESGAFFIFITYEKTGKPKEINFGFFKEDPLLHTLDPDRLYRFEENIKNLAKREIKITGKYIVNPKYHITIFYRDLK